MLCHRGAGTKTSDPSKIANITDRTQAPESVVACDWRQPNETHESRSVNGNRVQKLSRWYERGSTIRLDKHIILDFWHYIVVINSTDRA